ncbi:ECF transporter S component [Mobilitalea sibirica]|uniref:ECF transporter S component n=1 Tax=Mobilitalea sibirica TaxID=1462919 RepID=A0A8J7KWE9_9FIRM|nr:ECF transporter S component [Mobilitalea sibirica]MBH1940332.1 ECF transporter S component [Mobilitalea sibirica]
MNSSKITKLVTAALMAALTCVATAILPIKVPFVESAYIHPGDTFVILSGIVLGPVYGGLAAGIGSMFADLYVSYPFFWVTLIVKMVAAIVGYFAYKYIRHYSLFFACLFGGVAVTLGYFILESYLYGIAKGIIGAPFNIIQTIFSIILTSLLLPLLRKVPQIRELIRR